MTFTPDQLRMVPTEDDVSFYEQHGWWISPSILTAEDIDEARYGAERYYAGERDATLIVDAGTDWTEAAGNVLRQNDYVSLQIDQFHRFVRTPVIAAAAAALARTHEIRLFHDQLLYKPPRAGPASTVVGWHTDIAYWQTCSSRSMLTAWIPLQDVTEEMGPMVVLDGSHRWDGNDQLRFFHRPDLEDTASHIQSGGHHLAPIKLVMKRGQVSFHHCRTIHGSHQNSSTVPRLAIAIHLQDESNCFVRGSNPDGRPTSHISDFLGRKTASGDPDYRDPNVFPTLWPLQ